MIFIAFQDLRCKMLFIFDVTFDNLKRRGFSILDSSFAAEKKSAVPFTEISTSNVSGKFASLHTRAAYQCSML